MRALVGRAIVFGISLALGGVLVFSMSDPDRRIAQTTVGSARAGETTDTTTWPLSAPMRCRRSSGCRTAQSAR